MNNQTKPDCECWEYKTFEGHTLGLPAKVHNYGHWTEERFNERRLVVWDENQPMCQYCGRKGKKDGTNLNEN